MYSGSFMNVYVVKQAEKVTAGDPVQKEMATQKKEAKVSQAELDKLAAREHNAATKQSAAAAAHMGTGTGTGTAAYSTTGAHGQPMGAHQTSALPGHGTGHNTRVGGNPNATGYGTGGTYN